MSEMHLVGHARETAKFAMLRALPALDRLVRTVRQRQPSILTEASGAVAPGSFDRLCLFAHYDKDDLIDDYVVHYLRALKELGCEIVFTSTAEGLDEAQLSRIKPYTRSMIVRNNIGHDFASWKIGLEHVEDIDRFREIIIANDSVYGPMHDLRAIFDEMGNEQIDFWGITDSLRYKHHLQSYFVVFRKPALSSDAFRNFWKSLPFYNFKHTVVLQCEIGLSRALLQAGLRFASYCSYEKMRVDHTDVVTRFEALYYDGLPGNPTHFLWRLILEKYNCPFMKVSLLRQSGNIGESAEPWRSVLAGSSSYDANLIVNHQDRLLSR